MARAILFGIGYASCRLRMSRDALLRATRECSCKEGDSCCVGYDSICQILNLLVVKSFV